MESNQRTVKMPNGEIALATKVTPSEKAHIRCWNCKTNLIYEKDAETVKCSVCQSLNGTINHPSNDEFVVFRCSSCFALLKAPIIHQAISCCRCG